MMKDYVNILRSIKLNFESAAGSISEKNTAIISVGKAAAFMYSKFVGKYPETVKLTRIIILPENSDPMGLDNVIFSTHPEITELSFNAGKKLLDFIRFSQTNKFTVLISGGSSALIEHSPNHKSTINSNNYLLSSGMSIVDINRIRTENSLIKGGKLAAMFPKKKFTVFSMSDIPFENGEKFVGSMPFYSKNAVNSKLIKCSDCITLRDHLSSHFNLTKENTVFIDRFTDSVGKLAEIIKEHLKKSDKNLYVSTEPTLKVSGNAKGGRMSHLALSVLPYLDNSIEFYALSSDGIDGNSQYAGAVITNLNKPYTEEDILSSLEKFDSASFLEKEGFALKTGYTGINLNDFVLIRKKPEGQAL